MDKSCGTESKPMCQPCRKDSKRKFQARRIETKPSEPYVKASQSMNQPCRIEPKPCQPCVTASKSTYQPRKIEPKPCKPCVVASQSTYQPRRIEPNPCEPCVIASQSTHQPRRIESKPCEPCVTASQSMYQPRKTEPKPCEPCISASKSTYQPRRIEPRPCEPCIIASKSKRQSRKIEPKPCKPCVKAAKSASKPRKIKPRPRRPTPEPRRRQVKKKRKILCKPIPYRVCGIFIGVLGLFQSLIWIIMITFYLSFYFTPSGSEYIISVKEYRAKNVYWREIYDTYVSSLSHLSFKILIYCYIYAGLSVLWLLINVILLCTLCKNGNPRCPYKCWASLTIIICLVDVVASCLCIVDLVRLDKDKPETVRPIKVPSNVKPYDVKLCVAISIFGIISRGFIVWVLNLVCAIILIMADHKCRKMIMVKKKAKCDVCDEDEEQEKPRRIVPCSIFCSQTYEDPDALCVRVGAPPVPPNITLNLIREVFVSGKTGKGKRSCKK